MTKNRIKEKIESTIPGALFGSCIEERDWDSQLVFKLCDSSMHHDVVKLENGHYLYLAT